MQAQGYRTVTEDADTMWESRGVRYLGVFLGRRLMLTKPSMHYIQCLHGLARNKVLMNNNAWTHPNIRRSNVEARCKYK